MIRHDVPPRLRSSCTLSGGRRTRCGPGMTRRHSPRLGGTQPVRTRGGVPEAQAPDPPAFSSRRPAVPDGWTGVESGGQIVVPGKTEAGSAGKQPAEGYPGLRCAQGASGPGRAIPARAVPLGLWDIGAMPHKCRGLGQSPSRRHRPANSRPDAPAHPCETFSPSPPSTPFAPYAAVTG